MRAPIDVALSVQRYTAEVLPGWEVRLAQDRGEITAGKPLAMVVPIGPIARTGPARWVELTFPMAVHCYPLRKDTQEEADFQVLDVEEMLLQGFAVQGVGVGRPLRVPLFNYDGVDVSVSDGAVRGPRDYVRLENFDLTRLPDTSDPRLIRVIAGFTGRWRRAGYQPLPSELGGRGEPLVEVAAVAGSGEYDVEELPGVPVGSLPPGVPAAQGGLLTVSLSSTQGPPGPPGPVGPAGPEGEAGRSLVSGWWDYSTSVNPPPGNGQIRTAPDPTVVGPLTIWLSARDDDGLFWSEPAVAPGDEIRLRGTAGAVQRGVVTAFELTVPGPGGYGTIQATMDMVTGQIAKNARVEVALLRGLL